MPKRKRSDLAAGIFVLAAVGLLLAVVLWLGASDLFSASQQEVCFYVDEGEGDLGLEVGNPVKINDSVVGKITDIQFRIVTVDEPAGTTRPAGEVPAKPKRVQKGRTYYYVSIDDPDVRIYTNGAAYPSVPFVGKGWLVINDRGHEETAKEKELREQQNQGKDKAQQRPAPRLCDADHPIRLGKGGLMGSLATTGENLEQISAMVVEELKRGRSDALLAKIHVFLGSMQKIVENVDQIGQNLLAETDPDKDSVIARVRTSLADLNQATAAVRREMDAQKPGTVAGKVHAALDKVDQSAANIHKASADVAAVTADARPKIAKITDDVQASAAVVREQLTKGDLAIMLSTLRKASDPLLKAIANLNEVSKEARDIIVINRENIDETLDNLAQVSVNLKSVAKEVRRNPWKLFYTPQKGEERSANLAEAARAFSNGASELDQALTKLATLSKSRTGAIPADDPQLVLVRKKIQDSFARFSRAEQALWKALNENQ